MWIVFGLLAAVGLLSAALLPTASAQDTVEVTLEAGEQGCPEETYCFEVTEGNLDDVQPGDTLAITLVNPSDNVLQHNVHVTERDQANVGGDTPEDAAFAQTEDIGPGEEATVQAEVPDDAAAIYLWCSVNNHEQLGMYEEVELAGGNGDGGADGAGDGGEDMNEGPAPGVLAVLLVAGLVAWRTRR